MPWIRIWAGEKQTDLLQGLGPRLYILIIRFWRFSSKPLGAIEEAKVFNGFFTLHIIINLSKM
jgi:hypothetical protein